MKIIKRNAIILAAILFVCVAVYLNWAYNRQEETLSEPGARETVKGMAKGCFTKRRSRRSAPPAP